jgi:hypothetical protein
VIHSPSVPKPGRMPGLRFIPDKTELAPALELISAKRHDDCIVVRTSRTTAGAVAKPLLVRVSFYASFSESANNAIIPCGLSLG